MTRHQQGHPAFGEASQPIPQITAQHRVQAYGRLVEHEHLGCPEQRDRERHPVALTARQRVDSAASLASKIDLVDHLGDTVVIGTDEVGEVPQVLGDGQVAVDRCLLCHVADASAQRLRSGGAIEQLAGPSTCSCTPTNARMSVDLPHPLGPSSPTISPRATSKLRWSSTVFPPRVTRIDSTWIAGRPEPADAPECAWGSDCIASDARALRVARMTARSCIRVSSRSTRSAATDHVT